MNLGRINRIRAQYVAMDLAKPESPARLFDEAEKRELVIDMLINNAGFGSMGEFTKLDLARELNMIDLNIKSLVDLTYRFLLPMRARKQGTIINVASTAGFSRCLSWPLTRPRKRSCSLFRKRLWEENRPHGVHVMALCPGVTETNFFEAAADSKAAHARWPKHRKTSLTRRSGGLRARRAISFRAGPTC